MAETFKQNLTRSQLEEGKIPSNTVLLEMTHSSEGIKSKGGIIVGVNLEDEYEDETTSHVADLTEVYAKVVKLPDKLYYNKDGTGMPWDCDMDLMPEDFCWFNALESKNAVEILCEDKSYRLIPYTDIYCSKRGKDVIMLNGYVLCKPVFVHTEHRLAVDDRKEDKTRGVIAFVGKPNREYIRPEYVDFKELEVGDEVMFNPGSPVFPLERKSYLAQFDGNNLYNVIQRRRIALVLSKGN